MSTNLCVAMDRAAVIGGRRFREGELVLLKAASALEAGDVVIVGEASLCLRRLPLGGGAGSAAREDKIPGTASGGRASKTFSLVRRILCMPGVAGFGETGSCFR
ncbi:MAG: hypothetical protein ACREJ5_02655 [Geminicoccaceae bacterium]